MHPAGAQLDGRAVRGGDDRGNDVANVDGMIPSRVAKRVDVVSLGGDVPLRLAEPAPLVKPAQPVVQRAVGRLLQPDVEGGLRREAVLVELLGAVARFELLADFFDEVGGD